MEIDICCNGMDLMEALRAYLQRRMRFRFDRHPELIRKITVRLIEQNTSKSHGGKLCQINAELNPSGEILVRETAADLYQAIGAFTRTKQDVLAVRHLYADLDHDGSASLAAIEKSSLVPAPNYVLNTSPDKYQVIWRVEDIELAQAEALLHAIAREFDGDHAATDAARVLRVPGFMNKKYDQDFLVSAQRHSDRVYHARDFKLRTEPVDSGFRQLRHSSLHSSRSEPRPISQSE